MTELQYIVNCFFNRQCLKCSSAFNNEPLNIHRNTNQLNKYLDRLSKFFTTVIGTAVTV